MSDQVAVVMSIDWDFLREQKEWLIQMSPGDAKEDQYIEGLLGIIDAIQSEGASDLGAERVYGKGDTE